MKRGSIKISGKYLDWAKKSKDNLENFEEKFAKVKIALKLNNYLRDNGLNQKDLADKLGVSPQYVNKLLRGKDSNFSIETALKYGRILGIRLIEVCPSDNVVISSPKTVIVTIKFNEQVIHADGGISDFTGIHAAYSFKKRSKQCLVS